MPPKASTRRRSATPPPASGGSSPRRQGGNSPAARTQRTASIWDKPSFAADLAAACAGKYQAKLPAIFQVPPGMARHIGTLSPEHRSLLALTSDIAACYRTAPDPGSAEDMKEKSLLVRSLLFKCAEGAYGSLADEKVGFAFDRQGRILQTSEESRLWGLPQNHPIRRAPLTAAAIIGGTIPLDGLAEREPEEAVADDEEVLFELTDERLRALWSLAMGLPHAKLIDGEVTAANIAKLGENYLDTFMETSEVLMDVFWKLVESLYPDLPDNLGFRRGWVLVKRPDEEVPGGLLQAILGSLFGGDGELPGGVKVHVLGGPSRGRGRFGCGRPGCPTCGGQ